MERVEPKKARIPQPNVIAVRVASLDDKEFLLASDPENFYLRGQLATILIRIGKHAEAMDALRPLLDAPRVPPQVLYKLGVCAHKLGRRDEAVRFLEQAVDLAPDEARYRARLEQIRSGAPGREEDE